MYAFAPNGNMIRGTIDEVPVTALIVLDSFGRADGGAGLEFEWDGETKMYWDGQQTLHHLGETLYEDFEGNAWRESRLLLGRSKYGRGLKFDGKAKPDGWHMANVAELLDAAQALVDQWPTGCNLSEAMQALGRAVTRLRPTPPPATSAPQVVSIQKGG
jgi:hypothetical protein